MSSEARNIKLKIAYNGKNYAGWQIQDNDTTIQGTIEEVLKKIHKYEVKITGAGRTDAGVHARAQAANFNTSLSSIPAEKFSRALNSLLPGDIRILESREVNLSFNSRYDAVERIYKYQLTDIYSIMPWETEFSMYVDKKLDITLLNNIASAAIGTHDFSAFSAPMEDHVSTVKTIYSSVFYPSYPFIIYKISGTGFLRKMVRSIIGTIVEIYKNDGRKEEFEKILKSRDRSLAGATAPAKGLFLDSVRYSEAVCGRKNDDEKNT
ncbi:MAG: tRNA pseudouridine(38-40) synthase TruA [Spirochaetes bacterium]|nr:tRNA pseudouridine(38-40) synthase TruA [Spirochaetota bacterium]